MKAKKQIEPYLLWRLRDQIWDRIGDQLWEQLGEQLDMLLRQHLSDELQDLNGVEDES